MTLAALLLVLNLTSTWFMTGLIWFIQLVHYSQFAQIGSEQFCDYHRRHTRFTTFVVGPPMLIEGATAVALLFVRPAAMSASLAWFGVALVALLWLSTAFLQVPQHNRLAIGFDANACQTLNRTNWLRTFAWTARGVMMAIVAVQILSPEP